MPVFAGSRYETARLARIQMPNGEVRPYVYGRRTLTPSDLGPGTTTWTFNLGDALDQIAITLLGTELRWWVVADVNNILFPEVDEALPVGEGTLTLGRELFVPPPGLLEKS